MMSSVSAADALRELPFSDAVFPGRYQGWRVPGRGSWATVVRTCVAGSRPGCRSQGLLEPRPGAAERLREEVRAVQVLSTPYLVHTYSRFDRGSLAWFEMEMVDFAVRVVEDPDLCLARKVSSQDLTR